MEKVITHGGQAHADEFLALAFALALRVVPRGVRIWRRDPTPQEIDDPNVLVLDVGGQHNPAKNNFDHHQRGREEEPQCALSLFLAHYAPEVYEALATMTEWFGAMVELDVRGPFALAKAAGCSPKLIFGLAGAVHTPVVKLLEQYRCDFLPEEMVGILERVGESHLEYAQALLDVRKDVEQHARAVQAGVVPGLVYTRNQPSGVLGTVLAKYREVIGTPENPVAFAVMRDDRGEGLTLYRFADDPRVDFSRLAGREGVVFAHPGGFIAKTASADESQALALVGAAITE